MGTDDNLSCTIFECAALYVERRESATGYQALAVIFGGSLFLLPKDQEASYPRFLPHARNAGSYRLDEGIVQEFWGLG